MCWSDPTRPKSVPSQAKCRLEWDPAHNSFLVVHPESQGYSPHDILVMRIEVSWARNAQIARSSGRAARVLHAVILVPNERAEAIADRVGSVSVYEWADDGGVRFGCAEHLTAGGSGRTADPAET